MSKKPPPPLVRPKLATFIWERDLYLRDVGAAIDCSGEQVRRMCLPFGDPRRRVPGEALMARIFAWTDGEIRPSDFYPPELSPVVDAPAVLSPAEAATPFPARRAS